MFYGRRPSAERCGNLSQAFAPEHEAESGLVFRQRYHPPLCKSLRLHQNRRLPCGSRRTELPHHQPAIIPLHQRPFRRHHRKILEEIAHSEQSFSLLHFVNKHKKRAASNGCRSHYKQSIRLESLCEIGIATIHMDGDGTTHIRST